MALFNIIRVRSDGGSTVPEKSSVNRDLCLFPLIHLGVGGGDSKLVRF